MRADVRCVTVLFLVVAVIPVTNATAKAPRPDFVDLSTRQARLFLERVRRAPGPFSQAVAANYGRLRVMRARSKIGGGDYSVASISGEGTRFTVALSPRALKPGHWGDHMTAHELGHVIINAVFDGAAWVDAFELFGLSGNWHDCFADAGAEGGCVPPDEILADQLAFYATGYSAARSAYRVPPLANRDAFGDLLPRLIGR